ncbi:MAG: hypothetical protein HXX08_11520 [Chloroflexi bacterium]|uniref:Uncharacterized protein n=1 Tax=Candidatus Chlorohelix allophototropha TaxID=3003348 RepID=A0A8T7M2A2_9CHLR|nr:hypothetical protein [Chloroflexota bacterium]WJW65867.1 hypothetical protein OZ401_001646 [Chloroflexota bacterium L227-S17]
MFRIPAGTPCVVTKDNMPLSIDQMRHHQTNYLQFFEVEELIADPTGIGHCAKPGDGSEAGELAKKGLYVFAPIWNDNLRGWVIAVSAARVQYVD